MRVILTLLLFACFSFDAHSQKKEDLMSSKPQYGFIENKGQVRDQNNNPRADVKFILALPNNYVVLTAKGFSYDTYITEEKVKPKSDRMQHRLGLPDSLEKDITFKYHRVDVEFAGANTNAEVITEEPSDDYINYYVNGSEVRVQHYGKVRYKNIYPGVDVEFIARPGKSKPIEYNFIVQPNADLNLLRVKYKGANSSRLANGKLELGLVHGILTESIPASYGEQSKKTAKVNYKEIRSANSRIANSTNEITVGFSGTNRGMKEALVIDPTPSIQWGTYYGGTRDEKAYGLKVDKSKNVVITGETASNSGIATTGAHQVIFKGNFDVFIAKFNELGTLLWATYFGNTGYEVGRNVDSDSFGDIYVVGSTTSASGISTPGSYQPNHNGVITTSGLTLNGLIAKFSSSGSLLWSTYYYNRVDDTSASIYGLFINKTDDLYITGESNLSEIVESNFSTKGYIVKFNKNGVRSWQADFGEGGPGGQIISALNIQINSKGSIIIAGVTTKKIGIATPMSHQPVAPTGTYDGFLMKFTSSGVKEWGTYYGGDDYDAIRSLRIDSQDKIYVIGGTSSQNMIASSGAYQPTSNGGSDAFIVKFTENGVREWGTYYGGELHDFGTDLEFGSGTEIFVTGSTQSTTGIATEDAYKCKFALGDFIDCFLAKFDINTGLRDWGTYFGNNITDIPYKIGRQNQFLYITGYTFNDNDPSTEFISTPGSHKSVMELTTYSDAFLTKFDTSVEPCIPPLSSELSISNLTYLCAVKFSIDGLNVCKPTYTWNFGDGKTSSEVSPIHVFAGSGTYNVAVSLYYNQCTSYTLTKQITFSPASATIETRLIEAETDIKNQVINSSAATFSDSWPLPHDNSALRDKNSFVNGAQGVWRNDATYVYDSPRQLSAPTNLAQDGTFTLNHFDWGSAEFNLVPNWIRANTMTQYSPYSYELENRDVLGVYSAALYDYGGHLPSANGVNMRNTEMAFTSFEVNDGKPTGNWMISNLATPASLAYHVPVGFGHLAVIEATLAELELVNRVDVSAQRNFFLGSLINRQSKPTTFLQGVNILCKQVHPTNPNLTIVVLDKAPFEQIWRGKVTVNLTALPAVAADLDNVVAHSGKKSLKITADKTFRQELLRLEPGKPYWVNAWVSVNNPHVLTPVLASNLGIDVTLKDKQGVNVGTFSFQPAGQVIEGWQQVKGAFVSPIKNPLVEIKFKPGSTGTAWYDDLRLQPERGNMKAYVYDLQDYRLRAILDEENFASFFFYDAEGNLYLTKKETERGIKTITENASYQKEN